jgi:hypothetical protein
MLSAMKPELRQEQKGSLPPLRTGEPVDPSDLHVGDELICLLATGRYALAKVKRLKKSNGEITGFFPYPATRSEPDKAIEINRVIRAWRSPESQR